MKTKQTILLMMLGAAAFCTSCVSEDRDLTPNVTDGTSVKKGNFSLSLSTDASFDAGTRALSEANYRNTNNYTVQLINSANGSTLLECRASELGQNLPKELEIGSYEVKAFYGTEYDASRDNFRVEGSKTFTIAAEETTSVNVDCAPTCGKISVAFDANMSNYYEDYSVTFGGTAALGAKTIAWAKGDTEPWYVGLGASAETVTYTISLTAKEAYAIVDASGQKQTTGTATGSFQLERNKAQKLTITPNYTPTAEGGLSVTISIDDTTNDRPVTITVPVSWV